MDMYNQELIERTNSTQLSEIEPMYWIVEDSLHKGDNGTAEAMFGNLLYLAKHQPVLLKEALQDRQRERLQEISYELYGDISYKKRQPIEVKMATSKRTIPFEKESHLRDYLSDRPDILSEALQDDIRVTGTEVVTEDGYKCDITVQSSSIFYPIELKIKQGQHACISQINKYCFYFYRRLRYDLYKTIQGVVIANGFDAFTINEIRREGTWIFEIIPTQNDHISLQRL